MYKNKILIFNFFLNTTDNRKSPPKWVLAFEMFTKNRPFCYRVYNYLTNIKFFFAILLFCNLKLYSEEKEITIYSNLMTKKVKATVILPDTYSLSQKRYPAIYLLHGYSGNNEIWKRIVPLLSIANKFDLIFICPDAQNSWYVDSKVNPKIAFESFFIKEFIPNIDSLFRTIPHRNKRALCGVSMGGYGALALIAKYPHLFCASTSICGIMNLSEFSSEWELAAAFGQYETNKQIWDSQSITSLYKNLKGKSCSIALDCGISDFALSGNRAVHKMMLENEIEHEYYERPGSHNMEYPARVFKFHVLFLAEQLKK